MLTAFEIGYITGLLMKDAALSLKAPEREKMKKRIFKQFSEVQKTWQR